MHMYRKVGIPGCLAAPGPDQLALAEAGVSPLEAGRHDVAWVTERFLYIKLSELELKYPYISRMCRQDDIAICTGIACVFSSPMISYFRAKKVQRIT